MNLLGCPKCHFPRAKVIHISEILFKFVQNDNAPDGFAAEKISRKDDKSEFICLKCGEKFEKPGEAE